MSRKDSNGRVLPTGVSQRKDGRYIYRKKLETGKPFCIYDRDLTELKRKIKEATASEVRGIDIDGAKMDLDTFYSMYINTYKKGKVRASTWQNVQNYYNWYVRGSVLGKTKIKDIKRIQLVKYYKQIQKEKNLAYTTIAAVNSLLYNALQEAVYNNMLLANPCIDIMKEIPRTEVKKEVLSRDESKVLIEFLELETRYHVYLPIVKLMLITGMRWGEIDGLTWLDITENYILVNHGLNYRDRGNGVHEFYIDMPKTSKGIREIPLTEEMREMFMLQKQYQKDLGIRNDVKIDGYSDFVFTTTKGRPYTHEAICRVLGCIVKYANQWEAKRAEEEKREAVVIEKITPHKFRHTFSTRLAEADVNPVVHAKLMGHSRVETSYNVYSHISNEKLADTMNGLNGKLA